MIVILGASLVLCGYILWPKLELAKKDNLLLQEMSFLINARGFIEDYKNRKGVLPENIDDIYREYPDLYRLKPSTTENWSLRYSKKSMEEFVIGFDNVGKRDDLELTEKSTIKYIPK
jgi:hypothetical protein